MSKLRMTPGCRWKFRHKNRRLIPLKNRNVLNPTHNRAHAGRVSFAPRSVTFGPALITNVWAIKYAVHQEIQPANVAPRPNHCAYATSAVPGDIQYYAETGAAGQAAIAAMDEPAVGVEAHAVEAAAALQIILVAGENAATSIARPAVTNTDASAHAHLKWMPLDAGSGFHGVCLLTQGFCRINFIAYCDLMRIQTESLQKIQMLIKLFYPTLTAAVVPDTSRSIYRLQPLWKWLEHTGIRPRRKDRLDWGLPNLIPMQYDRIANSLT